MASKPTVYPDYAVNTDGTDNDVTDPTTGQNNVTEPVASRKLSGWLYNEKPNRQFFNWLHRITTQWVRWFDETIATMLSDISTMQGQISGIITDLGTLFDFTGREYTVTGTIPDDADYFSWDISMEDGWTWDNSFIASAGIQVRFLAIMYQLPFIQPTGAGAQLVTAFLLDATGSKIRISGASGINGVGTYNLRAARYVFVIKRTAA